MGAGGMDEYYNQVRAQQGGRALEEGEEAPSKPMSPMKISMIVLWIVALGALAIAIAGLVEALQDASPVTTCTLTVFNVQGVCLNYAAPPTATAYLCKTQNRATIQVFPFICNATGNSPRTAPVYFVLPSNYRPNVTFGVVAPNCGTGTTTCFNNTFPVTDADPNDPQETEMINFVTGGNYSVSPATVRTNHFVNQSIYVTLDMGQGLNGAALPSAASGMGPALGFTVGPYQTTSAGVPLTLGAMAVLVGGAASALLG